MKMMGIAAMASLLAATSVFAADQTWTGTISDEMCGATGHMVKLTGELKGDTIKVSGIEMPKPAK